jgi:16S rRNA (guanine966-N2)-methyltransferase
MENKIRIIAGSLKNRVIKIPKDTQTRPALALVRRVVCDTLMPYIPDAEVLDLFAGTGAFVFEMISREAESAVAVELDRNMANTLEMNAKEFKIADRIEIINADYLKTIERLGERKRSFDIIFVAPPFYGDYVNLALENISRFRLLKKDGLLMAHYFKKDEVNRDHPEFKLWKSKAHGKSIMDFFKPAV